MAPSATSHERPNPTGTSIPTPSTLQSSTPALPSGTNTALLTHLQNTGAIPDLSSLLEDSLARTGWTDRVRALALDLVRSGECTTFPELMEEIMNRAKTPKVAERNGNEKKTNGVVNGNANGSNGTTSAAGGITVREDWFGPDGKPNVRIPEKTVEAGVEFLKERIKNSVEIVEVDDDSD